MSNNKQALTFKRTVLSIVTVSIISGGLVALDKWQRSKPESDSLANNNILSIHENAIAKVKIKDLTMITEEAQQAEVNRQNTEQLDKKALISVKVAGQSEPSKIVDVEPVVVDAQLLFGFNSSHITKVYRTELDNIATQMKAAKNETVWQVIGYSDPKGNARYNNQLAKRRAQATAEFLIEKGVNKDQLSVVSLGGSRSIKVGIDSAQRRVEIHPYQAEIASLAKQLTLSAKQLASKKAVEKTQVVKETKKTTSEIETSAISPFAEPTVSLSNTVKI